MITNYFLKERTITSYFYKVRLPILINSTHLNRIKWVNSVCNWKVKHEKVKHETFYNSNNVTETIINRINICMNFCIDFCVMNLLLKLWNSLYMHPNILLIYRSENVSFNNSSSWYVGNLLYWYIMVLCNQDH